MLPPASALALISTCSLAGAATLPRVSVESCPASLSRGLDRFVAIELEALSEGAREIDVQVGCSAGTVVLLVSVDGRAQTRSMDLRTIAPSVRARVVALTAAELVRELRALPPPAPEPAPAAPEPAAREPALRPAPSERTSIGELEAFVQSAQIDTFGDVLLGGGLRFAYTGSRPWRLEVDFAASTFERTSDLGTAQLILAGLGVRLAHSLPLGALEIELGGGARAGVARISGSARDAGEAEAASVAGAWSAPIVLLGLDAPLSGPLRLGVDAEIGYVLLPVRGRIEGGRDVLVGELFSSLSLGLAVEL